MYKWLFFDLDGTLCDSLEDIKNALNEALNYYNFNANYSYDDCKHFIGSGAKILVKKALAKFVHSDSDYLNVYNKYNEIYNKTSLNNLKLFPNVLETLTKLKKHYNLAVLSNKPDIDTENIINKVLGKIFTIVRGQIEGIKIKPDKEAILNICIKYNINKDDILYIGDMVNDENLAINANIDFCYASYGYSKELITNYKYKISDFKSLEEILLINDL